MCNCTSDYMKSHHVQTADLKSPVRIKQTCVWNHTVYFFILINHFKAFIWRGEASLYWVTLRGITLNSIGLQRAHRNMIFDTTDLANIEPFRYITWSRVALGWVCSYLMYIIYKKIMNNWLIPERKHVLCCCLDLYGFPLLSLCCDKAKYKICIKYNILCIKLLPFNWYQRTCYSFCCK